MRVTTLLALGASAAILACAPRRRPRPGQKPRRRRHLFAGGAAGAASAAPLSLRPALLVFNPRGYYPYYGSGYWVPRAEMRYRYRYVYRGPKYRYYPAWGYGAPARPTVGGDAPSRATGRPSAEA